jgi:putative spermidine/putrescine transport system substrate-binding protein
VDKTPAQSRVASQPVRVGRRGILQGFAATTLLAAPAVIVPGRSWGGDTLVMVGWGGANQEMYEKIFVAAFTRDTGIPVVMDSGPDLAKIKAQVMTGNVTWDVVSLAGPMAVGAERAGLLEKIDYSIVHKVDSFLPPRETSFAFYTYWGGTAYNPTVTPPDAIPKSWADLWDAKRFPGRRGLRAYPQEMLEIALMADGVPPKQLYPLDIDRAFRSLDRIKPFVTKWIAQTPQTITLVQTKEITFSYAYAGRVDAGNASGLPIAFASAQPLINPNYIAVVKGTKRREAAMRLMDYFMRADLQAAYCNALPGNGPIARAAVPMLTGKASSMLPNFDDPQTAVTDVEWWTDQYNQVSQRFKEWLLTS